MNKLDSNLHLFLQGDGLEDTGIRMPDQQGTPPEGSRALTYLQAQFSESSLECEESGSDSGLIGPPVGRVEYDGLFPSSFPPSPPEPHLQVSLAQRSCVSLLAVLWCPLKNGLYHKHSIRLAWLAPTLLLQDLCKHSVAILGEPKGKEFPSMVDMTCKICSV